jgi:hypothetical protein
VVVADVFEELLNLCAGSLGLWTRVNPAQEPHDLFRSFASDLAWFARWKLHSLGPVALIEDSNRRRVVDRCGPGSPAAVDAPGMRFQ